MLKQGIKMEINKTNIEQFSPQSTDLISRLYELWNFLPACPALAIIGDAIQELQSSDINSIPRKDYVSPDYLLHKCSCGSMDVGATSNVANCYSCKKEVVADTHESAIKKWNETISNEISAKEKNTCKKCGGQTKEGVALINSWSGSNDFPGKRGVKTISPNKKVISMISVKKCGDCGHSFTE